MSEEVLNMIQEFIKRRENAMAAAVHEHGCVVRDLPAWHSHTHVHMIDHKPTVEEMETLETGHCFLHNGMAYVQAASVDEVHIKFVCPSCWTSWKKNGEPSAKAKRVLHQHGSLGGTVRVGAYEERSAHCEPNLRLVHMRGLSWLSGCNGGFSSAEDRAAIRGHEQQHLSPQSYCIVVTNKTVYALRKRKNRE